MKGRNSILYSLVFLLLIIIYYCNWKFEIIAINPFYGNEQHDLKVMTWNVHCSNGKDVVSQKEIAELILKEDADFVLLNEFYQDSCSVLDSLLRLRYHYTEEYQSHTKSGDIFYSKREMTNSGHIKTPVDNKSNHAIKATIAIGGDSVQIFGVHMESNHYDNGSGTNRLPEDSDNSSAYDRYKDGQVSRCLQAEWTKAEVLKSKHPVIVMGDMNDFNKSKPLMILRSCGLKDSWWEGGNGYDCTFHKGWMRLRIDHILYSKELKLENVKVKDTDLSDHNPVVAGFSISK